tara:strand:+ start:127 stop:609 length:483 start_codon:yes stop_codon:yes gene_type:complete
MARASPLIINIIVLVDFIITKNLKKLFFLLFIIFNGGFNYIIKHFILKPILGNKEHAIIGSGSRPKGAKNCGHFINNKKATTYGMPSGHSQNISLFVTYYILELLDSIDSHKNILILLLIITGIFIMYSRVKFRCHTIQQVILGGIIGVAMGNIFYKFVN